MGNPPSTSTRQGSPFGTERAGGAGRTTRPTGALPFLATLLALTALAARAWAGGAMIYEVGSPDTGTAIAGRAALAADASTSFTNPAGMSRLDDTQMLIGVQTLIGFTKFDPGPQTHIPVVAQQGGDGGNANGLVLVPGMFVAHSITPDLHVGMSVTSQLGAALEYDDSWVGRYYGQKISILTVAATPVVSYRVTDWLSLGGGPVIMYSQLKMRSAINNAFFERDPNYPDGRLQFKGDDWGVGGNIGFLITPPIAGTRFGVSYMVPVELNFHDNRIASGLGPRLTTILQAKDLLDSKTKIGLTMPNMLLVSGYHELTKELAVMGNFGWQEWSQFGAVELDITGDNPQSLTANLDFKNTYHGALGAQYRLFETWLLSCGVAYDSSALESATRSPIFPIDRQIRGTVGVQKAVSDVFTLGFQYDYLSLGSASLDRSNPLQGTLAGDYSTNQVNLLSVNFAARF